MLVVFAVLGFLDTHLIAVILLYTCFSTNLDVVILLILRLFF